MSEANTRIRILIVACLIGIIACSDYWTEIDERKFHTKREGTGLGLPIAKKIVEAHGGQMEIVDNSEKGITFRIVIPTASG